jgi:DNA-binding transcriptional LysR family regulator
MTAAAAALHMTQSAVSQQIARLETLTGPLFLRAHRRLRLTPAGERLMMKARHLVALNDALWADLASPVLDTPLRFGAPPDLVSTWLTPILKRFADIHAGGEIALTCAASPDLRQAVAAGKLDLALVEEPLDAASASTLMTDRLVWVGARGGRAHLHRPLPLSLVAETCAFRPAVLNALGEADIAWKCLYDTGSIETTNATVRADLAVTTWLESTVPADLLVLPPGAALPELPTFAIRLYRIKGEPSPATTTLEGLIRLALRPSWHAAEVTG